ncbi:Uncharacterised protein [Amycolatopsis camponoti]|uniref:Uncharacterized protein n=1 Tax=Amycolatopsis camponoti TaxID=2606593 RepID=A0A6I8LJX3_9PSEU|nr:hypothetical protein [Amycolatopsis camponoti]VVJ17212.1 Uncharacterised protein [Amycolatopsis camponoti]
MPTLVAAIDDRIEVEYGQFLLQEIPMTRTALNLPVPRGDWLAVGGPGGLLLHSAGTDHYPAVRLELWDVDPLPGLGDWDQVVEVACDLSDLVRLQSVTAIQSPNVLTIGRPGLHRARVHSGRRVEAAELEEGSYAEGVEGWLVQLWPGV